MYYVLFFILMLLIFIGIKVQQLSKGKENAEKLYLNTKIAKITNWGSVKKLKILPVVDSKSTSPEFKTENGVSMLIEADNKKILMDFGFNRKKEHPSPLLHNLAKLKLDFNDIDAIFISHAHLDHLGGMKEQQNKEFSISAEKTETKKIPVFSPTNLIPSAKNPQLSEVKNTSLPQILFPGIASIGTIPRFLFLMGFVEEQALAINVENKGIVLLVGCGHQKTERIIERTKALFDEPIFGIIGGLHFPLLKKNNFSLFGLLQYIVGSDSPPWKGLSESDLNSAIEVIKKEKLKFISLSPHDSSEYSIHKFRDSFTNLYHEYKVGSELVI